MKRIAANPLLILLKLRTSLMTKNCFSHRCMTLAFLSYLGLTGFLFSQILAAAPLVDPINSSSTCELISRGPRVQLGDSEVTLHTILESLLSDFQNDRFEHLSNYFDPKAKVAKDIGDKIRSIITSRYNPKLEYSIFRVWRIVSSDTIKPVLENCPESDGARIIGSYGYKKQYAIWIQILGQNELGRLILSIAPNNGVNKIVGFRIQQWTQSGDDWGVWLNRAKDAEIKKNPREAYFAYDIAQKLLDGKDFVVYPDQTSLLQKRDEIFSQKTLLATINADLETHNIAYIGTLLAKEGSGMFMREFIESDLPTATLQKLCMSRGKGLQKSGWLNSKQGIRCNYILKGMDPLKDSPLGGFYLTGEDLNGAQKQ